MHMERNGQYENMDENSRGYFGSRDAHRVCGGLSAGGACVVRRWEQFQTVVRRGGKSQPERV